MENAQINIIIGISVPILLLGGLLYVTWKDKRDKRKKS
jgi:hypothetical protein